MHPELDIQLRRKAHRIFHENILEKDISLLQTILPHPFVDSFKSRGGGAVLIGDKLYSRYKSGVLNGKWRLPLIGEQLVYGELQAADRARFNQAMMVATGKMVVAPDMVAEAARSTALSHTTHDSPAEVEDWVGAEVTMAVDHSERLASQSFSPASSSSPVSSSSDTPPVKERLKKLNSGETEADKPNNNHSGPGFKP